MERKIFIKTTTLALVVYPFLKISAMLNLHINPEKYFFEKDGIIPNSRLPLLVYRNVFSERGQKGAIWLENKFRENSWYNSWRWGIYFFHHYHSNTHEVLGVFQGWAEVHVGGSKGKKMRIKAGDIIVIPAGVGHKCLVCSEDFTVVGAYPEGKTPDLIKEETVKYNSSIRNISKVSIPLKDPLLEYSGLVKIWR